MSNTNDFQSRIARNRARYKRSLLRLAVLHFALGLALVLALLYGGF